MTGAELVLKILIDSGVDTCFGYPGGSAMPLYDALYKNRDKIKHYRGATEQGAGHAADGYARSSGKLAVCMATSGPGATNLITSIATAFADSVPVLFITSNVTTDEIGTDSFQEADITGMTLSITKYNWIVKKPEDLASVLYKAIKLATSGRKGPVLVDIPKNVLLSHFKRTYNYKAFANLTGDEPELRLNQISTICEEDINASAEIINNAKKPVIIMGGGVYMGNATQEVLGLAEKIKAPIVNTLMAVGLVNKDNPYIFGMIGKYGENQAKEAVSKADLIIAVGMRFSNRTHEIAFDDKKIIHIDEDVAEVDKNIRTDASIIGDAKESLDCLIKVVGEKKKLWIDKQSNEENKISEVFEMISRKIGDRQVIVSDVGTHQMEVAKFYPFSGYKRFMTSGGFGTMGFGLGAAIGAKIAENDDNVILFTGDGSFKMDLVDLVTIRENKLKILIVILNNGLLKMVYDMQTENYGGRIIATRGNKNLPDFAKLAKAYGLLGVRCSSLEEIEKAIDKYKESNKSMVIDFRR